MIALIILLVLSVIFESSVTMLPLTLAVIIAFSLFYKNEFFIIVAFIAGLILDILTFKTVGLSSLIFLITLLILNLYERKLEPNPFVVFFISFLFSFLYLFVVNSKVLFFDSLISAFVSLAIFAVFIQFEKKLRKNALEIKLNG